MAPFRSQYQMAYLELYDLEKNSYRHINPVKGLKGDFLIGVLLFSFLTCLVPAG